MPSVQTRRRRASKFERHVKAHKTVIGNETWFGDAAPDLGPQFTAKKTAERARTLVKILVRAAKREKRTRHKILARPYTDLAKKVKACRPNARCGSLACPQCARAFQKAKVAAQENAITNLAKARRKKRLAFATVVPKKMMFTPAQFSRIDIRKANRWLKDALMRGGIRRVIMGSADLGLETRRGGKYIQLHWHLVMWTGKPHRLKRKLKLIFPRAKKYERPVDVAVVRSLGVLPYMAKAIKLPDLLRRYRKDLGKLLLVLDRTEPLDILVLTKLRLSAQQGGLAIRQIGNSK